QKLTVATIARWWIVHAIRDSISKTHRSHHRQMMDRSRVWRVHFHRLAAVATPGGGHHLSRVRDAVVVLRGLRGCHASRQVLSA
ncbi:MAG: hypothetical protein ACKN9U_22225, partial [Pirellulaceae bacterium]